MDTTTVRRYIFGIMAITAITFIFNIQAYASMMMRYPEPSIATYTHYPIFQSDQVPPNVMILLDNSGSMESQCAYPDAYNATHEYYGYFTPAADYSYVTVDGKGLFVRDSSGQWSGNFLNWLSMRRIDVARLALVGGRAESRDGSGVTILDGYSYGCSMAYVSIQKDNPDVSGNPYADKPYTYFIGEGRIIVTDLASYDPSNMMFIRCINSSTGYITYMAITPIAKYNIRVKKDSSFPDEAINFVDGNYAGIIQKIGNKVRWGNAWFNIGYGEHKNGAYIANPIGTSIDKLVYDLSHHQCDTWTPLAESYYTIMHYFEQQPVNATVSYFYPYQSNYRCGMQLSDDPYYIDGQYVPCAKSFVIIVTDGGSTKDIHIPKFLQDYDNDGNDIIRTNDPYNDPEEDASNICSSNYLDDVALYAHTIDLRPDLPGKQTLTLFTIYAFGNDATGKQLLEDAAKNGGFIDQNDNNKPDLTSEWDSNNDGIPDNYFSASEGQELQDGLFTAFNRILALASSGTSVSVLSTRGNGEGFLCQAYFKSSITEGSDKVNWLGFLRSFWVDSHGNIREDSNNDHILEVGEDKILKFYTDSDGNTKVNVYNVSPTDPYPDLATDTYTVETIDDVQPIWDAGKILQKENPNDRKIFTYIGPTNSTPANITTDSPFDSSGDVISFNASNYSILLPFLGVDSDKTYSYLGSTEEDRAKNLINYIRGEDASQLIGSVAVRTREVEEDNGTLATWKLGDIIHSAPVVVGAPPDRYDFIYHDKSYYDFYQHYKDREDVVYVGANDGMLHAFTAGTLNATNPTLQYLDCNGTKIGTELWAFIPEDLLPQLKWLSFQGYTHVDYVDLTPKVFDAKIFTPDSVHINGWGTILVCGLRFGGKFIWTYHDGVARYFYPCFFAIDVTQPRHPRLLWERILPPEKGTNTIFATSFPAVVKEGDKWFLVYGTGPTSYEGTSNIRAGVYVLDLKTGDPVNGALTPLFDSSDDNSFFSGAVSLDKNLNYNVDAVYLAEDYATTSGNVTIDNGKIYKIFVPAINATTGKYDPVPANYSDTPYNPTDTNKAWRFSSIFTISAPITAPIAITTDTQKRVWIYGGTGRYFNINDKSNTDAQYLFGFKDPFYNSDNATYDLNATYYHSYPSYNGTQPSQSGSYQVDMAKLFNSTGYNVTTGWTVTNPTGGIFGNFYDLIAAVNNTWGWIYQLTTGGEKSISKPLIYGGIVLYTTFQPDAAICEFGGKSYLYGLYYLTGTAYPKPVFEENKPTSPTVPIPTHIDLGIGLASRPAIHMGINTDTAFVQQSNGEILTIKIHPAHVTRSGLTCWGEKSLIK